MKRDIQGKFALKNEDYRLVRSLRLTDSTWVTLGITSECLGLTRADYLEQIIRENALPNTGCPSNTRQNMESLPSNTRYEEEIELLKLEIQNLTQKNVALMERTAITFSQVELELLRDRILLDLKLGKQAPGYKAVQKALNRFIAELTDPNRSVF
ncbi:hypothetical protein ACN23B_28220 (plasmid) [Anabaena sp. FACHB-709]|uniref:Uncharacterized protein n=2 Tax=Nostocaceae TaxID=1162 RepID=A0A1Z4KV91_ANAVA|nr:MULTISPECIES: hypothetical protein [Nostocaceae]BAY72950.1 hypothetical protein NIES23_57780 [Trichormus variabilis NIES-23]MBD2175249.1 hypothetical protein [Anabaena cylindrica FACHB-318]MBD2267151.1 hypothetical protein [Anabaena sp. FACHB-709]MBD2276697.1 hypothetical protein [Nostoc sp. PCC 7120 = FACHB-418]MBD2287209.1 hypothetical protein [Anabaena cylindrica FACHB-170]